MVLLGMFELPGEEFNIVSLPPPKIESLPLRGAYRYRMEILNAYADTLGEIHKAGVVYGSNHLGNMILEPGGNKVFFIDFKTSDFVTIDWETINAEDVCRL